MLTKHRAVASAVAIALGLATGWWTARTGGSPSRAPAALLIMIIGLGGTGLAIGILLGRINDKVGVWIGLLLMLSSYYLGTWVSPWHSLAGDLLFLTCSSMPAGLTTGFGFAAGRLLHRTGDTRRIRRHRRLLARLTRS